MSANLEKAKFLRNTRRFYQHLGLSRHLHQLIREIAPRYGKTGQELLSLLLQYETLVEQSTLGAVRNPQSTIELAQLPRQVHQKLYALLPQLGSEKQNVIEVMRELEALHPHLYKPST